MIEDSWWDDSERRRYQAVGRVQTSCLTCSGCATQILPIILQHRQRKSLTRMQNRPRLWSLSDELADQLRPFSQSKWLQSLIDSCTDRNRCIITSKYQTDMRNIDPARLSFVVGPRQAFRASLQINSVKKVSWVRIEADNVRKESTMARNSHFRRAVG